MTLPDARALLAAADAGRSLPAADPAADPADLARAIAVQDEIAALRRARGERPVGWKIGFTNRTIWPLYGVDRPIWAPVWDTTLMLLDGDATRVSLARLAEPRLEPEIVVGLRASPPPEADASTPERLRALVGCIDWVAHGVEIVHSVWPGWRFDAARAIAAQSLHGALRVGPRVPIDALGADPAARLSALRLVLRRDGERVAEGVGANVLDGPLQALGHLVAGLAARGERVAAGGVVTTGTLTDAMPLAPGQSWRTGIEGAPLAGLALETVE
ncbi:MAG TPA: hypothetical protein VEA81_11740 [Burkholderiaceae bacterium]|nr:hypothetical protein [Burkholderiaceae bacterium]